MVKKRSLAIAIGLTGSLQAVIISGYTDALNDRFTDSPSFIGNTNSPPLDLTGVGRTNNTPTVTTWGTLIGDNYFISAAHSRPNITGTISFFNGNNTATATQFDYTVAGGFNVPNSDLWIGYTNEIVDPSIARYAYATSANPSSISTLADLGLGTQRLYLNGDQTGNGDGDIDQQSLGTNVAEGFYDEGSNLVQASSGNFSFGTPTTLPSNFDNDMVVLFRNLADDFNTPTGSEAHLQSGDSGSVLFSEAGGVLTIQGVASIVADFAPGDFNPNTTGETRQASFYNVTASYTDELAATIAMVPAPVPEPTSALLLLLSIFPVVGLRRR